MKKVEENAKILEALTLTEISGVFYTVQQIAEDIPCIFGYSEFALEKELLRVLKDIVRNSNEIYSCTVTFEPYMFDKTKYYFAPYFYKPDGIISYLDLGNDEYDYFKKDWYIIPKKLNKGVWGNPHFDEGGKNRSVVTYSHPFYKTTNGKRQFWGVVACEIELDWLEKFLAGIKIFETGYVFVLSSKGVYVGHKNKDYTKFKKDIFSLAEKKRDAKLKELGKKMTSGQSGFAEYYSYTLEKKCFVSYTTLREAGWSVGVVIPVDELFSDLNTVTLKLFIMGVSGYVLTLVLIIVLATRMTMPLRTLANATYEIGKGDFNAKLPVISSTDEIGVLSRSFHSMQKNLVKYIANLQETTAAKEKIEKELSIAREIQQSLLPHNFSQPKQIDLYATLIPAKEVGGDLYDFFFIDENHLCFAVGDVSGKGVPAALFMAVTKTLLRAKVSLTMDPAKVLNAMNEDLRKDNESCMFVTLFLGIFNIETGLLEYCNAGHTPPLIHTTNRSCYYFHTEDPHPPLGIMTDVNYVGSSLKLLPEDIFFLYTDGVTEAMDINNMQFSEEQLLEVVVQNKDETIVNMVNNVKTAVERHVGATIQSDDITMLILKYNG